MEPHEIRVSLDQILILCPPPRPCFPEAVVDNLGLGAILKAVVTAFRERLKTLREDDIPGMLRAIKEVH
jgi:hypothetical protein